MKQLLYIPLILAGFLQTCQPSQPGVDGESQEQKDTIEVKVVEEKDPVYICTGSMSECYHKTPNCEGLDFCMSSVIKIEKEDAKKRGRRPCNFCYK